MGISGMVVQVNELLDGLYIVTFGMVSVDVVLDIVIFVIEVNVVVKDVVIVKKQVDECVV